jgi:hypothetical protein
LDRGYDDYIEGRISDDFWTRKSQEWESELDTISAELSRLSRPARAYVATGEKILRTRENGPFPVFTTVLRGTASTSGFGAIELHLRSRNSLSYLR